MTLSFMVMVSAYFFGFKFNKHGVKGTFGTFLQPMPAMAPINVLEEFTSFLSLGIRIFGNILVGEILLELIAELAYSGDGA
jgi:F-type H+-transporting ATPase subunit a